MTARPAPLNHVAISMPRAALDDAGRAARVHVIPRHARTTHGPTAEYT